MSQNSIGFIVLAVIIAITAMIMGAPTWAAWLGGMIVAHLTLLTKDKP